MLLPIGLVINEVKHLTYPTFHISLSSTYFAFLRVVHCVFFFLFGLYQFVLENHLLRLKSCMMFDRNV